MVDCMNGRRRAYAELETDVLKPARQGGTTKGGRKYVYLTGDNRKHLAQFYDEAYDRVAKTFGRGASPSLAAVIGAAQEKGTSEK